MDGHHCHSGDIKMAVSMLKILSVAALQLNAQAIGNAIDEGIVGRYGAYVVDGPVAKSLCAQRADIRFSHIAWRTGEFNCIIQHGKISCLQVSLPVIRGQCGQQLFKLGKFRAFDFQQSTESRPVMMQSIAAFVFRRNDHGDHFSLNSAQGTFTVHQLLIQVIVLPHGPAVNAVNPENVVLIRNPVIRRNHFFSYIIDVCHLLTPLLLDDAGDRIRLPPHSNSFRRQRVPFLPAQLPPGKSCCREPPFF